MNTRAAPLHTFFIFIPLLALPLLLLFLGQRQLFVNLAATGNTSVWGSLYIDDGRTPRPVTPNDNFRIRVDGVEQPFANPYSFATLSKGPHHIEIISSTGDPIRAESTYCYATAVGGRRCLGVEGDADRLVTTIPGNALRLDWKMTHYRKTMSHCGTHPAYKHATYDPVEGATDLLSWNDWYPMNRNQNACESMARVWKGKSSQISGQISYQYGAPPRTLPASYRGADQTYYLNANCYGSANCSASNHLEVISQRDAGPGLTLDVWAHGRKDYWVIYYDTAAFGDGVCSSPTNPTVALKKAIALKGLNLEREDIKAPLSFRIPKETGKEWVGPPVCRLIFNDFVQNSAALQSGHAGAAGVGVEFVVGRVLGTYENGNVTHLLNEYYNSNPDTCKEMELTCLKNPRDIRCDTAKVQPKRKTTLTGGEEVTACLYQHEQYWVRKVTGGTTYRDKGGFEGLQLNCGEYAFDTDTRWAVLKKEKLPWVSDPACFPSKNP